MTSRYLNLSVEFALFRFLNNCVVFTLNAKKKKQTNKQTNKAKHYEERNISSPYDAALQRALLKRRKQNRIVHFEVLDSVSYQPNFICGYQKE